MQPVAGDLDGAPLLDEQRRRHEFPVAASSAFLAHAAVAALPRRVRVAIADALSVMAERGQFSWVVGDTEERCRRRAAALLGVLPEEIAFTGSTSAGLATVASGWQLDPGDEVLIAGGDFPSLALAWAPARRRGVVVRELRRDPTRPLAPDRVLDALRPRTRVVTLSTAHWISGSPASGLCELWRRLTGQGIRLVLDAVQTLGVLPVCGAHADVVVADGHKWLLGPQGFGLLMVRQHLFDEVQPVVPGWRSVSQAAASASPLDQWATTARRYEAGGLNLLGLVGLDAALELLEDVRHLVSTRTTTLRHQLVAGLRAGGHELLGDPGRAWSSIVAFRPPDGEVEDAHEALLRAGVVVSVRQTADGRSWLRAAPHFYNSPEEIERLLRAVPGRAHACRRVISAPTAPELRARRAVDR